MTPTRMTSDPATGAAPGNIMAAVAAAVVCTKVRRETEPFSLVVM
jgi:hypothetical protein